jgi:hypothetical protein
MQTKVYWWRGGLAERPVLEELKGDFLGNLKPVSYQLVTSYGESTDALSARLYFRAAGGLWLITVDDSSADTRTFIFVPDESYADFMFRWFTRCLLAQMSWAKQNGSLGGFKARPVVPYDQIAQAHGRPAGTYNAEAGVS